MSSRKRTLAAGLLAALLALAGSARAISPPWTPLGPFGGDISTLTADPARSGTLYATTPQGIFKTVDGGGSWSAASLERPASNVAIDPLHPSTLYAGVYGSLLIKSTDGGAHWAPSNAGLPASLDFAPTSVAVDPTNPNRLLLAYISRLWRSTDAGASWRQVTDGIGNGNSIFGLAFAARPAGTAFLAASTGLYRSTDAGASWRLAPGLPADLAIALAVSPADPRTLYVALERNGLYRSVDSGASWQRATSRTDIFGRLFPSPHARRTLYSTTFGGPIFRSTDGGAHWSTLPQVSGVTAVAFDAAAARRLYAGTLARPLGGVWRSDDDGATWARRSEGMTGLPATALAVDPGDPDRLWVQSTALFRSANRGMRWARATSPSDSPLGLLAVGASAEVFATVPVQIPHGPRLYSLFRTADDGASWMEVLDAFEVDVRHLRVAPSDPATIYAAGAKLPDFSPRFYRSTDNGAHWELRSSGAPLPVCQINDVAVAPSSAAVVYLAGVGYEPPSNQCERLVIRSDDGGASWTFVSTGLPAVGIVALAVDPHDPGEVYAGAFGDGVWKSTDGGRTWNRAGGELAGRRVTALLASATPGRVYAVVDGNRVFRSDDGGASWQGWSRGLRTSTIVSIVGDPGDPRRIYAATANGVWALTETD